MTGFCSLYGSVSGSPQPSCQSALAVVSAWRGLFSSALSPVPLREGGKRQREARYHMVISGYLGHQSTQFRLSASELLLFVSVVLVLINALYGIPNCDDLVS